MAKLTWHNALDNKYELGVSECALYVKKDSVNPAANTEYEDGVAWSGITSIQESPDGADANDMWADNMKYGTLRSAETIGGTIEAYTHPDEFYVCDGVRIPIAGMMVYQQKRKNFGLVYKTNIGNETQTDADDGYRIHIIYNCTASPSDRQYESINDSPDAITFSWEFDTVPVTVKGTDYNNLKPLATIVINSLECKTPDAKNRLALLQKVLYGSSDTDPYLPNPETVLSIMAGTNANGTKVTGEESTSQSTGT